MELPPVTPLVEMHAVVVAITCFVYVAPKACTLSEMDFFVMPDPNRPQIANSKPISQEEINVGIVSEEISKLEANRMRN